LWKFLWNCVEIKSLDSGLEYSAYICVSIAQGCHWRSCSTEWLTCCCIQQWPCFLHCCTRVSGPQLSKRRLKSSQTSPFHHMAGLYAQDISNDFLYISLFNLFLSFYRNSVLKTISLLILREFFIFYMIVIGVVNSHNN
jgi:hypothetical protein